MGLVMGLVAAGCSRDVDIKPPTSSSDQDAGQGGDRADRAQETLDRLVMALRERSAPAAEDLATSKASPLLAAVVGNAQSLDLRDLSMRYVDAAPSLSSGRRAQFGPRAWAASVELQYAFGGVDTMPARVETTVVFVPEDGATRIAGFGGEDARTPLWLAGRLSVVRRGKVLVAVAGDASGRYPGLAQRAVTQVRRTLPDWRGPLVVEVPGTREALDAALDARPGEYDAIAGVTTTEDGSLASGAPVRVFLNLDVFGKLAARGAQVVISHETTHVATGATFVDMPTWLLEGFADYVALRRAGVPVSLAAGQILPRIRKEGLPRRLPTSADLDPRANGLGATYEEAWLACRFLGQEYGARRLVTFYRAVSGGESQQQAFREVLGTTEKEFVAQWRVDLARLAGIDTGA